MIAKDGSDVVPIEVLWDALADFPAHQSERAVRFLLSQLCELVNGQNANWFAAIRVAEIGRNDPLLGWRPRAITYLHPSATLDAATAAQLAEYREHPEALDISIRANVAQTGRYRANRLVDLVPPDWFSSRQYQQYFLPSGRLDAIYAGCPVSTDAEVYIGVFRGVCQPRFSEADRDLIAMVLRSLRWFHRQQLLNRGFIVAEHPLTQTERRVLMCLLQGTPEARIADELGNSAETVHVHVKSIYRKFGVRTRAALMALWLGALP